MKFSCCLLPGPALPGVYEPDLFLTWKGCRTPAQPWLLDVAFGDACEAATPLDVDSGVDAIFSPYGQLEERSGNSFVLHVSNRFAPATALCLALGYSCQCTHEVPSDGHLTVTLFFRCGAPKVPLQDPEVEHVSNLVSPLS